MEIEITHDDHDGGGRYLLLVDGRAAGELDHRDADGVRTFTHTRVDDRLRGRGLAAQLVERGLVDAREEGLGVVGQCTYVARYLTDHPEHADLVDR